MTTEEQIAGILTKKPEAQSALDASDFVYRSYPEKEMDSWIEKVLDLYTKELCWQQDRFIEVGNKLDAVIVFINELHASLEAVRTVLDEDWDDFNAASNHDDKRHRHPRWKLKGILEGVTEGVSMRGRIKSLQSAILLYREGDNWRNPSPHDKFPLTYGFYGLLDYVTTGDSDKIMEYNLQNFIKKIEAMGKIEAMEEEGRQR